MYRNAIVCLAALLLLYSCHVKHDDEYFYKLDEKNTIVNNDLVKISEIYQQELAKYKKTHDLKYLISSKYEEQFLYPDNKSKKISLIYELLRINDGEYKFITVACNFFLAIELRETSPKLCLQFLNEAIKVEEESPKKVFLPHLFQEKGTWYYDHKNYSLARLYFGKAFNNFHKKDTLYVASMYNNLALCDYRVGNLDSSIKLTVYGIKMLENKPSLSTEELYFMYKMKGNLGTCYLGLKEYDKAIENYNEQLDFQIKNNDKSSNVIVRNASKLFELFQTISRPDREIQLVKCLLEVLPNLKSTKDKIIVCELLQKYYSKNNDLNNLKLFSEKLKNFNTVYDEETARNLDNVSDILNGYIIKSINQKYDFEIEWQKRKNILLIVLVILLVIVFIRTILKIIKKNRVDRSLLQDEKDILESNYEDLEKDMQLHKGKIKNLHLNLNLKNETEKAFLENLKKIRKSKNIDAEETVKDLFFKINNLLHIDEKNDELISESFEQNKQFMEKLSHLFPALTNHELKLCVYFRLNLLSKEVSLLENITPGSVRVYKTKIKYKIGLTKEQDLNTYLNSIK